MNLNIVPMREAFRDARCGNGVVRLKVLERLVREDDPPSKGDAAGVALKDIDFMVRVSQFHGNREVEPGRPAADACDPHGDRNLAPCLVAAMEIQFDRFGEL